MNLLTIIGNLCSDPDTRTTANGKSVCSFRVAVNRRKHAEGQPEADFFRVTAWSALADNCQKYLKKGKKVAITGPVSMTTYQNRDGQFRATLEVIADEVEFLSPKDEGQQGKALSGYVEVNEEELPWG